MKKKGCLGCLGFIVLIIVLGAILGGGSDNNNATSSKGQSQQSSKPEKKDGLTYEKFVNLKMGCSYEDVKKAIGKEGQLQSQSNMGSIETKMYIWNDGMANMNCTFQGGILVGKAMASLQNLVRISGDNITLAQFGQIQPGMSYDNVKSILGRDGFLLSQMNMMGTEAAIYVWMNTGGANLNISFGNGSVNSKTQIGLK